MQYPVTHIKRVTVRSTLVDIAWYNDFSLALRLYAGTTTEPVTTHLALYNRISLILSIVTDINTLKSKDRDRKTTSNSIH